LVTKSVNIFNNNKPVSFEVYYLTDIAYKAKGPVIIYGRGGGRRKSIMQPEKIITPPFLKQNF
jgi:hypothetical protein